MTANAIGEKEKLLISGKSKRPHTFPKNQQLLVEHFDYKSNKCGWMTSEIFIEYLNKLNSKMRHQNCNILSLLDNCPSHPQIQLSNVTLCFYPKNTTSTLQAMDQGVIANFKKKYTKRMSNMARIAAQSVKDVTEFVKNIFIFDAAMHAVIAWNGVTPETIKNCFQKSGVYDFTSVEPVNDDEDGDKEFTRYFQELLDVPWDEYLAMEAKLEHEEPARAPQCPKLPVRHRQRKYTSIHS